ncbi:hypothetical protein V6N13_021092 [Hibiscus sabdariffa]
MNGMGRGKDKLVLSNVEGAGTSSARHDQVTSVKVQGSTTDHMDLGENIVNIDGGNLSNVAVIQGSDVASDEVVNVAETTLNNEKHTGPFLRFWWPRGKLKKWTLN